MELSEFKLITDKNQIKKTDYLVILQTNLYQPMIGVPEHNIVEFDNKKYELSIYKGKVASMLKQSKEYSIGRFRGYKIVMVGFNPIAKANIFLAYKELQHMVDECSVFSYKRKVDFELTESVIENHFKSKTHFTHPQHN